MSVHLNGNAIYNLADKGFREFYFSKIYAYSRNDPFHNHAYDLDIYFYMTTPAHWKYSMEIAHQFQYTEMIQNYYHTNYSCIEVLTKYPLAYLVHGGYRKP